MMSRRMLTGLLSALPFAAGAARPAQAQTAPGYDALLDTAFEGVRASALAAAVVGLEGVTWTGARGVRRAGGAAVTTDDLWHLGSNTKAMTAVLYARLVEAGRARWGATLPELFPDLSVDPAHAETTIEDLLSHRAGVLDTAALGGLWFMQARADTRSLPDQRRAVAERVLAAPPTGERGVMAYGNGNYVLAGAAIERITGQSWEDALRAEVFQPLGITRAGFGAPQGDQPWGHADLFGSPAIDPTAPNADNPAALGPAGTVHMSLSDYGRFLAIYLGGAGDFLSADSIARLITPAPGADYALGWAAFAHRDWAQGPMIAHEGSNTLWHVVTIAAPARGLAFVGATNDSGRGGDAARSLVERMIQATT